MAASLDRLIQAACPPGMTHFRYPDLLTLAQQAASREVQGFKRPLMSDVAKARAARGGRRVPDDDDLQAAKEVAGQPTDILKAMIFDLGTALEAGDKAGAVGKALDADAGRVLQALAVIEEYGTAGRKRPLRQADAATQTRKAENPVPRPEIGVRYWERSTPMTEEGRDVTPEENP